MTYVSLILGTEFAYRRHQTVVVSPATTILNGVRDVKHRKHRRL